MLFFMIVYCCISISSYLTANNIFANISRQTIITTEALDVVIPCHKKDSDMLKEVITGVKKHIANIRRIIVVSSEPLTTLAEWYDEKKFPFSIKDVQTIFQKKKSSLSSRELSHLGWYYQQLLKLYSSSIIPGISTNVLLLDADTVFFKDTTLIDAHGNVFYNVGTEYHKPYFEHANRLLPGFKKLYPQHSGICHFMLMQRPIVECLFAIVEDIHQVPFWKAFCQCVDPEHMGYSGASEYEIYFNFALQLSHQVKIKPLQWHNAGLRRKFKEYTQSNYHYVSFHSWLQ